MCQLIWVFERWRVTDVLISCERSERRRDTFIQTEYKTLRVRVFTERSAGSAKSPTFSRGYCSLVKEHKNYTDFLSPLLHLLLLVPPPPAFPPSEFPAGRGS